MLRDISSKGFDHILERVHEELALLFRVVKIERRPGRALELAGVASEWKKR